MSSRAEKLSESDTDALPAVRTARTLASFWPWIGAAGMGLVTLATMGANVKNNSASIEQLKAERGAEYRLLDERLRRIEESVATIAGQMKSR